MATLSEHAENIKAAIKAARDEGFQLSLENGEEYGEAYVDLEEYGFDGGRRRLLDWENVILDFN